MAVSSTASWNYSKTLTLRDGAWQVLDFVWDEDLGDLVVEPVTLAELTDPRKKACGARRGFVFDHGLAEDGGAKQLMWAQSPLINRDTATGDDWVDAFAEGLELAWEDSVTGIPVIYTHPVDGSWPGTISTYFGLYNRGNENFLVDPDATHFAATLPDDGGMACYTTPPVNPGGSLGPSSVITSASLVIGISEEWDFAEFPFDLIGRTLPSCPERVSFGEDPYQYFPVRTIQQMCKYFWRAREVTATINVTGLAWDNWLPQ